jgi:AcrR family transcriptional regulator
MPYPAQTNQERIIETAAQLIEAEGVEQLSLARLAAALGIKAPSLYRYVASKDALIQAVLGRTFEQLLAAYEVAIREERGAGSGEHEAKQVEAANGKAAGGKAAGQLRAILRAHREFAHRYPQNYMLAFTVTQPEQRVDEKALEQGALPIQALMAEVSGTADSLAALRGALALVHGFVMLELKGQFRRGGDLTEAFEAAVRAYLAGWERRGGD